MVTIGIMVIILGSYISVIPLLQGWGVHLNCMPRLKPKPSTLKPFLCASRIGLLAWPSQMRPTYSGPFKATSPDLTLNGGLYREWYRNGLELGIEIILDYPDLEVRGERVQGSGVWDHWGAGIRTRATHV